MRTTSGLPFNSSYACTFMHEFCNHLFQSFFFPTNLPRNHELYQGVAPPWRTYLTYRWGAKQGKGKGETQASKWFMHMGVCLITLNLPLITCNLPI